MDTGAEPRLPGRLAPSEMFPAGVAGIATRHITLSNGVALRIAESGSDDPVLLLHGWGASIYMWRGWFAPLASAGRRVVAVDLPGHGLSDKPADRDTYRLETLVETVREVTEQLGLRGADVVAQSMAGTIALELALRHRADVGRLALVNPACFGKVRLQPFARLVSPSLIDPVLPHLVARWLVARTHRMVYGEPERITPRDEEEYWAPSQFPSYAKAMRRLLHEFEWRRPSPRVAAERLRALSHEALVVLGARDTLVRDSRRYVELLRASGAPLTLHIAEGGGHAVNEERPDEISARVLEFIAR